MALADRRRIVARLEKTLLGWTSYIRDDHGRIFFIGDSRCLSWAKAAVEHWYDCSLRGVTPRLISCEPPF